MYKDKNIAVVVPAYNEELLIGRVIETMPDCVDRIYIVDKTARIQVFDTEGNPLSGWRTPAWETGKPTGLSIGSDGNLLVADTHYYRLLVYSPQGELLKTIGGTLGQSPGEFGQVTDAVQDSQGNYYVAEKGEYDRIQKFSPDGKFLLQWGGHGREPGQFVLPQSMAVDQSDHIWVVDACNHRIQIFDTDGNLLRMWGTEGRAPGELYYPYDLAFGHDGHVLGCRRESISGRRGGPGRSVLGSRFGPGRCSLWFGQSGSAAIRES